MTGHGGALHFCRAPRQRAVIRPSNLKSHVIAPDGNEDAIAKFDGAGNGNQTEQLPMTSSGDIAQLLRGANRLIAFEAVRSAAKLSVASLTRVHETQYIRF